MSNVYPMPGPTRAPVNDSVQVVVRSLYGQNKIYPANTQAELLASIAGTKTLTWCAICGSCLRPRIN